MNTEEQIAQVLVVKKDHSRLVSLTDDEIARYSNIQHARKYAHILHLGKYINDLVYISICEKVRDEEKALLNAISKRA